MIVPGRVPILVPAAKMSVIIVTIMVMISIVVMPETRPPRSPIIGIILPAPRRMPDHIIRNINVTYDRPGRNDISGIGTGLHRFITALLISSITWIGRFAIF
jgi:hypothetical protein